jgi:hypothetical protein
VPCNKETARGLGGDPHPEDANRSLLGPAFPQFPHP